MDGLFPSLPADSNTLTPYGLFGDYVGGVWGTALTLLTFVVIFMTWRSTRKADERNSILAVLAEMLTTHDAIVSKWPEETTVSLKEFSTIYKTTWRIVPCKQTWSVSDRVDI